MDHYTESGAVQYFWIPHPRKYATVYILMELVMIFTLYEHLKKKKINLKHNKYLIIKYDENKIFHWTIRPERASNRHQ